MFINNEWVFLNRTIGSFPKLVHVPTHFFKIVVLTRAGSGMKNNNTNNGNSKESMLVEWWPANSANKSVAIGAFLVPNADHIDAKVRTFRRLNKRQYQIYIYINKFIFILVIFSRA